MSCNSVYVGCSHYPEQIFSAVQEFESLSVEHRYCFDGNNGAGSYRVLRSKPLRSAGMGLIRRNFDGRSRLMRRGLAEIIRVKTADVISLA